MGKPQSHSPGEIGMICRKCKGQVMYCPSPCACGGYVHVNPGPCRPA